VEYLLTIPAEIRRLVRHLDAFFPVFSLGSVDVLVA